MLLSSAVDETPPKRPRIQSSGLRGVARLGTGQRSVRQCGADGLVEWLGGYGSMMGGVIWVDDGCYAAGKNDSCGHDGRTFGTTLHYSFELFWGGQCKQVVYGGRQWSFDRTNQSRHQQTVYLNAFHSLALIAFACICTAFCQFR